MYYLCNGFIYCPVGTRPAAANVASAKREGMKKLVCLFLLLPLLARAGGQTPEVTESDKKGSEFVSNIRVTLNATYEQACLTLDKFVRQYKYNLDSLFEWALRGMKLKGEKGTSVKLGVYRPGVKEQLDFELLWNPGGLPEYDVVVAALFYK